MSYVSPASPGELTTCLGQPGRAILIAGGTDLLIGSRGLPVDASIVDLGRLAGMRNLERIGGALVVGAGVTVARLARDPLVRRHAPALADAADQFGSVQIRNRATIGGNVANGSAAADLTPALVAMAATADLMSGEGVRPVMVEALLTARPVVPPGTVITAFRIPVLAEGGLGAFVKLGRRQEPTISRLTLAASGPRGQVTLVAGALGLAPLRLGSAGAALNAGGEGFAEALALDVAAAIPGRASLPYKARAVRALGLDLLLRLGLAGEAET